MADSNWHGNASGRGTLDGLPLNIKDQWNWGAFLLAPFWGLSHKKYLLAFLSIIPIVGLVPAIMLGYKGNEYAWQNVEWKNTDDYQQTQKIWARIGAAFWFVFLAWRMLLVMTYMLKH